ncbi:MAG: hypothetical protein L0219_05325 [Phycisphaerales bacterium]|nr:hypothetical protein [Phycisphaerales bacterium]MCI0676023.1 hypothetical protein [Phycisphaerales bacterium]
MSAGARTADGPGFFELWLRRCGERPWRSFLRLWLIFLLFAVVIGFVGLRRTYLPNQVPGPTAIPYADYLAGGSRSNRGVISIDRQSLPVFDPTIKLLGVNFGVHADDDSQASRLVAHVQAPIWTWGYPCLALSWGSSSAWDVTDPSKSFRPAVGVFYDGWTWSAHGANIFWTSDASRGHGVGLYASGFVFLLAAPQGLAIAVMFPLWSTYALRRRKRLRQNRCVHCGHQFDPSRHAGTCSECGSDAVVARERRSLFTRSGLLNATAFLVLLGVWIPVQLMHSQHSEVQPVEGQLELLQDHAQDTQRTFVKGVYTHASGYGWPIGFLYKQTNHMYSFSPGVAPTPAQSLSPLFEWQGEHVVFHFKSRSRTIDTLMTVNWGMAIAQIGILQIAATIVALLISRFARMRRRRASRAMP